MALGLGSVGFGSLATFVTLYYASRQWDGAALALTMFGCAFIGAPVRGRPDPALRRLPRGAGLPADRILGLFTLWLAPLPGVAWPRRR